MKKTTVLFGLLVLLATPCVAQKRSLIESDTPFGPDASIRLENMSKIERGLINDVRYEIYYSDGGGRFASAPGRTFDPQEGGAWLDWHVRCEKDAITDAKSCMMFHGDFSVFAYGDGKLLVHIGDHHYPGSEITIR